MDPTDALRTQLRAELAERIPAGGSDADTTFPNAEIDELLLMSASIYEAAWHGWRRKMALALDAMKTGVIERQAGRERHKFVNPKEAYETARKMVDFYADLIVPAEGEAGTGSAAGEIEHSSIVGVTRGECPDVSRLLGLC